MSDANTPPETSTPESSTGTGRDSSAVSPETRSMVEQRMPEESDEIKHHMTALIDAIKRRAETQMNSAEDISRDAYVTAMRQAQDTLQKTGDFFEEQRSSLEQSIAGIEDTATKNWETLLADVQKVGDRFDRAIHAAWTILTEQEQSDSDSESPS